MKAILVPAPGGPEALVFGDAPEPTPQPGEVLVNVRAAGVNRADVLQADGRYPPPPGASEILGLEAAGTTADGRRVFFLLPGGGYAERVAVPREMLMPIPDGMSFEDAASLPEAFFTAHLNLFLEAALERGERVLVHAATSGVGIAALQLARRAGCSVAVTGRSAPKLQALVAFRPDLVIDTSREDVVARVEAAFGKNAVDVILDPVGGSVLAANVSVLAPKGRLVLIATMGGPKAELDLRAVLTKRLRLIGSTMRSRPLAEKIELTKAFVRDVLPGFVDESLKPVVDSVFPLAEASAALRRMASNENVGKIVLKVPG